MNRLSFLRRFWLPVLLFGLTGLLLPGSCEAAAERTFSSSTTLSTEAALVMHLLDQQEYDHASVHSSNFAEVIPDYMTVLDGQHLFFLDADEKRFAKEYGSTVYYNVAYLGNIDPAYDIFETFQDRLKSRADWIAAQIKLPFNFSTDEQIAIDRSKAPWPADQADADSLWRRRLKFELLSEMLDHKTLDQSRAIVGKRYKMMVKNLGETEGGDLAELYLSCITKLYDPHSEYMSADSFEDFLIQMNLHLEGIGATLTSKDDYCTVESLVPGGPADLGRQLKPNDRILSVAQDGQQPVDVVGMSLRKVVSMIRGHKGTRVHLAVESANSKGAASRREIVITRDVVKLDSQRAHAALFQVPGADGKTVPIGVIAIPEFYADPTGPAAEQISVTKDVAYLLGELKQAGMQGLVLDLRHNGGGFLDEAISLTGLFVPQGPVVQVRESTGEVGVDSDAGGPIAYSGPMAVLVDRMTASASEIVAGALQNYGRAIIIGDESTHGKGTVQTLEPLRTFSRELADSPVKTGAAKITIQKFYLPNGSSTQLKGVVPDIILPTVDDYLPIGESSLPHALVWDRIPSAHFDGQPVDSKTLATLRSDSRSRQSRLEEFAYLRKVVDWFKNREEEKYVSLNLDERRREKQADDLFRKQVTAERDSLAKDDFARTDFRLGPVPPKPPAADDDSASPDSIEDDSVFGLDENTESFEKMDVHLRETLRILDDAISLGQNRADWASNHPPLALASK